MADIGGGALHLMDLGREAARAKVFKPRSRFGPVVVNAARAIGRFGRDAIAETRRPFDMAGPEIKVRPFDPGSVSTGAIASKALLSFMAGNRARANFRSEQAAKQAKAEQDAQIAASTISRNAAQAGYYDRGRTDEAGLTPYQRGSLGLRRELFEWSKEHPAGGGRDPLTAAFLGLAVGGLRGEAGAQEADLEAQDEARLAELRLRVTGRGQGAIEAARELGITNDELAWASRQRDEKNGDQRGVALGAVADRAIARLRPSLKARRRGSAQSAGAAAVRAMIGRKVPGMPTVGTTPEADGTPDWIRAFLDEAGAAEQDEE